jgi:hypothetical protein
MGDAELLIVLSAAAVLIVVTFFSSLRRKRRNRVDYWLPDGSRLKRKADRPFWFRYPDPVLSGIRLANFEVPITGVSGLLSLSRLPRLLGAA